MSTPDAPRRFGVITLFPEMFDSLACWGVTGRAHEQGLWALSLTNPREVADDRHGTVDDRPYGGGPGMVMQAPVMDRALERARERVGSEAKVVALTPQGRVFNDGLARELAKEQALIFVAGRYEGIDERFLEASVDLEVSIGDFVVSGGELPAMMVMDALIRLIPGALGHGDSANEDSFANGMLDCPHYTRPEVYRGAEVPGVLLSGDHRAIARWRRAQSLRRTMDRRPDLLTWQALSEEDRALLKEWQLNESE
jgi:tRNA (guanine37-N1)-methyltransferase